MSELNATNNITTNAAENELVLTHVIDAPRELVFKAWTEAEHLKNWWGPQGTTLGISKLDFQPGGVFLYNNEFPDGNKMWGKFVYGEIVAPEKFVYTNSFSDEEGNTVRAPFSPTWPLEILNTLTLTEHEDKTTLTMTGNPINATEEELNTFAGARPMLQQGFAGTFGQLADYLAKL